MSDSSHPPEALLDHPDVRASSMGRVIVTAWHHAPRVDVIAALEATHREGLGRQGLGRVLALAVSVTLSAAVIYVQSTEHPTHVQAQAAAPAPPTMAPPAAAPQPIPASQADLLAASAPVAAAIRARSSCVS